MCRLRSSWRWAWASCSTYLFARTKIGYEIKAYGLSAKAAEYAGISTVRIPVLVFALGGALAGLAGYHYFAAVPGVFKIARNYGFFGDLAFYGIICGLISQGNPIAAIPVALLFGGLSIGGRFVQGKLGMRLWPRLRAAGRADDHPRRFPVLLPL